MTQTIYDAMKSSQNPYQRMLLKQIATSDDLFSLIPFQAIQGEGFSYEREKSLGSFSFIAPGGTVAETNGTTERVTATNREATEDFFVPNFSEMMMSEGVSQLEMQTRMKLKAAGRALASKMVTGNSISSATVDAFDTGAYVDALVAASPYIRDREGPGELKYTHAGTLLQFRAPGDADFGTAVACASDGNYTVASSDTSKWITVTLDVSDATVNQTKRITFTASNDFPGLNQQCPSGQVRAATGTSGDALAFSIMEELIDAVKNRDGQLAFVMNSALRRKYNQLVRTTGAAGPEFVSQGNIRLPTFSGIPILTNDNIPSTETGSSGGTTLSSVYLVNLSTDTGVGMAAYGGRQDVMADPRDVSVMGFRLYELGQKQGSSPKSEVGRRLCWFGTMFCKSDLSIARAKQLITA